MQVGRVSAFIGGLVLNRMILQLAMISATIATGTVARAQAPTASSPTVFRWHFEESESHRGVDAHCPCLGLGVLGHVAAGGRQYFYVPVWAHAATYRPTIQRFDKVILEGQAPQGPQTDAHES